MKNSDQSQTNSQSNNTNNNIILDNSEQIPRFTQKEKEIQEL